MPFVPAVFERAAFFSSTQWHAAIATTDRGARSAYRALMTEYSFTLFGNFAMGPLSMTKFCETILILRRPYAADVTVSLSAAIRWILFDIFSDEFVVFSGCK